MKGSHIVWLSFFMQNLGKETVTEWSGFFGGADAGDGITPFTFHDIQDASRDKWAGDSLPLWGKGCIIIFFSEISGRNVFNCGGSV